MENLFIGIDPGHQGGVSAILESGRIVFSIEMPTVVMAQKDKISKTTKKSYKSNLREIGVNELFRLLLDSSRVYNCHCTIEKSRPMPNQGSVSGFNYGVGYGEVRSILKCLVIPLREITPQEWKAEFDLINRLTKEQRTQNKTLAKKELDKLKNYRKKEQKQKAAKIVEKIFPEAELYTKSGRLMDGKAESLLIAEYAKRKGAD